MSNINALNEYFKFNFQQLTKALTHFVAPASRPAKITKVTVASCLLSEQVSIDDINEYLKTLPYGGSDARFPRSTENPGDVMQNNTYKTKVAKGISMASKIAKPKLDKVPIIDTVIAQTQVENINTGEVIASGIIGVDNQGKVVSTDYDNIDKPYLAKPLISGRAPFDTRPVEIDTTPVEKQVDTPAKQNQTPLGDVGIILDAITELLPELIEKQINDRLNQFDRRIIEIASGEVEKAMQDSTMLVRDIVNSQLSELFQG